MLIHIKTESISRRSSASASSTVLQEEKHRKPKGMLKITFLGEQAVDDGGPKQEFFSGKNL